MNKRVIKYGGAITGEAEEKAIIRSIRNSRETANWQQAEEGALFEQELSSYLGIKHTVLTNSGSSAGLLALTALELPEGSEVIIPATTFPTIFNIIPQCGLVPVVVDSKIGTYNLDPKEIESAISSKTKAIICVHALGNPVDMREVMEIARKHNLYVIEDNCDGISGSIDRKKLGSFGHISFTSFHAAHIVSMGVGGGVFTSDDELAKRVRMYRDWGRQADATKSPDYPGIPADQNPRFVYEKIGYNLQILELQAAMGRVQLKKVDVMRELRKKHFDFLYEKLSRFPDLVLPKVIEGADVCWFAFPLSVRGERAPLLKHLEENGIETRTMFAGNIIKHPAYANSIYRRSGALSGANEILEKSFWVSCHPRLIKEDLVYMVKVFEEYYAQIA